MALLVTSCGGFTVQSTANMFMWLVFLVLPLICQASDFDVFSNAWCRYECSIKEFDEADKECFEECLSSYTLNNQLTCDKALPRSGSCPVNRCIGGMCTGGMDLCCPDEKCGFACLSPDPDKYEDVPPIPTGLIASENTLAYIPSFNVYWDLDSFVPTIYVVQERHYNGCKFYANFSSPWSQIYKFMDVPPATIDVKPGTWYQVRVAAISQNGSLGFSKPSKPFKTLAVPKPPEKPTNLWFTRGGLKNGTGWGVLSWAEPYSELPVTRYTVFWSKRIASEHTAPLKGSVFVHEKTISGDRTYFKIKNLNPNVQYFIQVQAQSRCGGKLYKSEKEGLVINCTDFDKTPGTTKLIKERLKHDRKRLSVCLSKIVENNGTLTAKIHWKARPNTKYSVVSELDDSYKYKKTIIVMGAHCDLKELKLGKTYKITVTEKNRNKMRRRSGVVVFIADPSSKKIKQNSC